MPRPLEAPESARRRQFITLPIGHSLPRMNYSRSVPTASAVQGPSYEAMCSAALKASV